MNAFRTKLEEIVASKPSEWLNVKGFRFESVDKAAGCATYIVIIQHRDNWQNFGGLKKSLADIQLEAENLSMSMELSCPWFSPSILGARNNDLVMLQRSMQCVCCNPTNSYKSHPITFQHE